jgi:hypothetical protein
LAQQRRSSTCPAVSLSHFDHDVGVFLIAQGDLIRVAIEFAAQLVPPDDLAVFENSVGFEVKSHPRHERDLFARWGMTQRVLADQLYSVLGLFVEPHDARRERNPQAVRPIVDGADLHAHVGRNRSLIDVMFRDRDGVGAYER